MLEQASLARGVFLGLVWMSGTSGCHLNAEAVRQSDPATLRLELLPAASERRRPAVLFPHGKHSRALAPEGCAVCHPRANNGTQIEFTFAARDGSAQDRMDSVHDACIACHVEKSGTLARDLPVTCGECHTLQKGAMSQRLPMHFDYRLHARHVAAEDQRCATCHHRFDQETQSLVHVPGQEGACHHCHGATAVGQIPVSVQGEPPGARDPSAKAIAYAPPLRQVSHARCVNCHLDRALVAGQSTGPIHCDGCHGAKARALLEPDPRAASAPLAEPPRLLRGQPDQLWVHSSGAKSHAVAFDHQAHESLTKTCSTCHHRGFATCVHCHTLFGSADGHGVSLAAASHHPSSERACIGCHRQATAEPACAGCHAFLPQPPAETACATCHQGLPFTPETPTPMRQRMVPARPPTQEAISTAFSPQAFPERLVLEELADDYGAAVFPHRQIVNSLARQSAKSALARRFHPGPETLCAGCHHHSPTHVQPPSCGSCHGAEAHRTRDQPSLLAAYHRRCLGCHQEMGLTQIGCNDCHPKAGRGSPP